MKPINLNNIEEKNVGGGNFPRLKPGAYACKVTEVIDHADRGVPGRAARHLRRRVRRDFSDKFYADKPWTTTRRILSYKDANLGYLKRNLRMFTESNTGFDAEAAIVGQPDQMLVGKVVGCTFRERRSTTTRSRASSSSATRAPTASSPRPRWRDQNHEAAHAQGR